MGKVVLNETPIRTSNNYGINDISIDLEIPKIKEFENVTIEVENDNVKIKEIKEEVSSKIGLKLQSNYGLNIIIPAYTEIKAPIRITFEFDEENANLVDNIKIIMEEGASAKFIIEYLSNSDSEKQFHYLKQETIAKANSKASIIIANLLNEEAESFIAIENDLKESSKVSHTLVEFGGKTKISNYYSNLNEVKAENDLKTVYLGTNNDILDINYNIEEYGKLTKCSIEVEGAINKKAHKNFKGTIDFKEGASKSKGTEIENCVILSEDAKSKSLPMLLCHEEDVEGEHRSIFRKNRRREDFLYYD